MRGSDTAEDTEFNFGMRIEFSVDGEGSGFSKVRFPTNKDSFEFDKVTQREC